jgi:hypothetical protein
MIYDLGNVIQETKNAGPTPVDGIGTTGVDAPL